ncbi:1233_t:CDS:1, partial [Acaulospora morrowiae]
GEKRPNLTKAQQEPMTLPSNDAWKTIEEHTDDKTTTKQEEMNDDLEKMTNE